VNVLLLLAVTIVQDGKPQVRLEHDGSPAAEAAAEVLQRHVVLIAKTALPKDGGLPALSFAQNSFDGYRIEAHEGGMRIEGRFPVVAAYDLLREWGCRFGGAEPHVPGRTDLAVEPRVWRNERPLYVESARLDLATPATGIAARGLGSYPRTVHGRARQLGYRLRVASTTFDDFLPVSLFEEHPEWFALRRGERRPRGNFALTNADARTGYLDRVEAWLDDHPEVDCLGIWPEVTTVWCEESEARGHAESYALLWREAAARFPGRRFEILATGLTLKPPAGTVPDNVDVRLRPGRDASALQGLAGQPLDAVARAWKVRGARVFLEIDGAPESWCGLPWPNHDAIRADAARGFGAVLVHPDRVRATIWHDRRARVAIDGEMAGLLARARSVRSWGDPADAADLWPAPGPSPGARAGAVERLRRRAMRPDLAAGERRAAANGAWFTYGALARELGPAYRRAMDRRMRRMLEEVLPDGASREAGPAQVRETFEEVVVETNLLRLSIDRRSATVLKVERKRGTEWSGNLLGDSGRGFAVVALGERVQRAAGEVFVREGKEGTAVVELAGRTHAAGSRWEATLRLDASSARVAQEARVDAAGGIAAGFRFGPGSFDEWVSPSYAREGRFEHPEERRQASFRMVPGEALYVRRAPRGTGIALVLPRGGVAAVVDGSDGSLLATSRTRALRVDWVVFTSPSELR